MIDSHAREGTFPAGSECRKLQPFTACLDGVADGEQCAGTLLEVKPCAMDRNASHAVQAVYSRTHLLPDGRTPAQMLQPLLGSYDLKSIP